MQSSPTIINLFIQLFNPISVLNDTITGVIFSVKIILTNVIGFFKSKDGGYDKCNDTGSGLFGFENRNKEGKIISESGGDCGGDKTLSQELLVQMFSNYNLSSVGIILTYGCRWLVSRYYIAIFTVYFYYFWSYLRITTCHLFCIKKINYNNR